MPSPGRYLIALGHGRHNVLLPGIASVADEHELSWVKCEERLSLKSCVAPRRVHGEEAHIRVAC